ncbi:uroporphyrinogen-III C-methyltransferase [Alicyclobacillus mali (ex Roth et al. 2021)]|uniref:uroporphyrinogen-III C-methyltransferase n=1 Tax=Alicyclobacillus mali (ex Roth et al. 2021) TaxID=1123961 RepID=UPI001A8BFD11|nr:uroporphyrinogen-III C-methyltransferase [Alicyclobacillus mali (ex Roth et al. 2021)]
MRSKGHVALVGAGPGHPGLLTERAKQLLEQADAIVYDRLVSPRILLHTRSEALLIYVGKQSDCHLISQRDIERILVQLSHQYKLIVRLKGGDPYVFGRGSEEAEALSRFGVSWEVVPGVTSAVAVPAFAGVPVTMRGVSRSFAVVTGHTKDGAMDHVRTVKADVLVLLMGVREFRRIAGMLIANGVSPHTPGIIIEWGTRSRQRKVKGRLVELADLAEREAIRAPSVIVVGDVAERSDNLDWHGALPRVGSRVVVLASTKREALMAAETLEAQGAEVGVLTWDLDYEVNCAELSLMVERLLLEGKVGIVFRTTLAVETWFCSLSKRAIDVRRLSRVRFAAVDGYVADALRRFGIQPDAHTLEQIPWHQVDEWWVEEVPCVPANDLDVACGASSVRSVRRFTCLERRSRAEVPDCVSPYVRTLSDVMRAWISEGEIDEVVVYGDVRVLRPLAIEYGLDGRYLHT